MSEPAASLCWSCRADVGTEPVCPTCVKVQPLGRGSDYFAVMGLPRRLGLDAQVLEPVFHALSRRFHPDVYRLASPRERVIALENSALLNQAYRTLRDPFERAAYLADLELGRAGEAGGEAPPAALFETILEVQEALGEYRLGDEAERARLRPALEAHRGRLREEQAARAARLTGDLFARWDAGDRSALPQMRALLAERSYLRRVLASLDDALDAGGAP